MSGRLTISSVPRNAHIPAIKAVRWVCHLGLREARDIVLAIDASRPFVAEVADTAVLLLVRDSLVGAGCTVEIQEDGRTMADLAKEALDIQNAVNLRALVKALDKTLTRLYELGVTNTEHIWRHPITVLWTSKLESLTNAQDADVFGRAYEWAKNEVKTLASHEQVAAPAAEKNSCGSYTPLGREDDADGNTGDPRRCYTCDVMPDEHK